MAAYVFFEQCITDLDGTFIASICDTFLFASSSRDTDNDQVHNTHVLPRVWAMAHRYIRMNCSLIPLGIYAKRTRLSLLLASINRARTGFCGAGRQYGTNDSSEPSYPSKTEASHDVNN